MDWHSCNDSGGGNAPHPDDATLQINCRNVWFREFWSQHNKCGFDGEAERQCTGDEAIQDYEQEGLVPFVGEFVHPFRIGRSVLIRGTMIYANRDRCYTSESHLLLFASVHVGSQAIRGILLK